MPLTNKTRLKKNEQNLLHRVFPLRVPKCVAKEPPPLTESQEPTAYVIAGPNGAGKTTFAQEHLLQHAKCNEFASADLSPFKPASHFGAFIPANSFRNLDRDRTWVSDSILVIHVSQAHQKTLTRRRTKWM